MKLKERAKKVLHFFNLETELENQDVVYEEIKKGTVFKGTNLWILIFAIVIASVGLNMNSTPVIIGAMLISPLMGPINGMGYSIATYDFDLFKRALKNFLFAITASLIASTVYFSLTPVSSAYSELLARTSPTIYDVLIALFGGLAGIVAISSKQKGNILPGVAIATALMPPLCTAGYGIATRQPNFFYGAFYLFTINTIFIAMASVLVAQLLNFPIRTVVDEAKKKTLNRIITVVTVIVLLPSIYFGYKLIKQEEFIQKATKYVSGISKFEGKYLLKSDIDAKSNKITLIYGGSILTDSQKNEIIRRSKDFGIQNASIVIEQGLTFGGLDEKNLDIVNLKEQIATLNQTLGKKNVQIDSLLNISKFGIELLNEMKILFPQVNGCLYTVSPMYKEPDKTPDNIPLIILSSKPALSNADKTKIHNYLKQRLNTNHVKIFYE